MEFNMHDDRGRNKNKVDNMSSNFSMCSLCKIVLGILLVTGILYNVHTIISRRVKLNKLPQVMDFDNVTSEYQFIGAP